jgi:hypothetical protein
MLCHTCRSAAVFWHTSHRFSLGSCSQPSLLPLLLRLLLLCSCLQDCRLFSPQQAKHGLQRAQLQPAVACLLPVGIAVFAPLEALILCIDYYSESFPVSCTATKAAAIFACDTLLD